MTSPTTALQSAEAHLVAQINATADAIDSVGSGLPEALARLSESVANAKVRIVLAHQGHLEELANLTGFISNLAQDIETDLLPAPTVVALLCVTTPQENGQVDPLPNGDSIPADTAPQEGSASQEEPVAPPVQEPASHPRPALAGQPGSSPPRVEEVQAEADQPGGRRRRGNRRG